MQTTAHFVFWSIVSEVVLGFGLALLINRKFRHSFWTTIILPADDAFPCGGWKFLDVLVPTQIGLFNYVVSFFRHRSGLLPDVGDVKLAPWSIVLVDVWM